MTCGGYTGYTGLNRFGYRTFGTFPYAPRVASHYIGKREAEAEADPALLYTHGAVSPHLGYGYGYSGLPYKTYSGFGYPLYAYGLGK